MTIFKKRSVARQNPYLLCVLAILCPANGQLCSTDELSSPRIAGGLEIQQQVNHSGFRAELAVRIDPKTVCAGDTLRLTCQMRCLSASEEIYNGFLSEHLKLPVRILIVSGDGTFHKELLREDPTHSQTCKSTPWLLRLRPGHSVGREFTVTITNGGGMQIKSPRSRTIDLPPGEYYVQAIYNRWLVAMWPNNPWRGGPRPSDGTGDAPRFLPWSTPADMDRTIGVSKPVKLVVDAAARQRAAEPYELKCPLRLDVRLPNLPTVWGRTTKAEITITNQTDRSVEIYDPLLNPTRVHRAFELALLSEDGALIGDILERDVGSWSASVKGDWIMVPPGGFISSECEFNAGKMPGALSQFVKEIPPGKYFLEVRMHAPALSSAPACISESKDKYGHADRSHESYSRFAEWQHSFPGEVICRSNRVELEILPRTGD